VSSEQSRLQTTCIMTGLPSELSTPTGNVTYIALVDLITFREGDIRTFDLFHIYDAYSYHAVFLALHTVAHELHPYH
jgi:hypothetical protein